MSKIKIVALKNIGRIQTAAAIPPLAADPSERAGPARRLLYALFERWNRSALAKGRRRKPSRAVCASPLARGNLMSLRKGVCLRIRKSHERCVIHCISGMLWITQEGDWADHLIAGGSAFEITRGGLTVIEALQQATISVDETRFTWMSGSGSF